MPFLCYSLFSCRSTLLTNSIHCCKHSFTEHLLCARLHAGGPGRVQIWRLVPAFRESQSAGEESYILVLVSHIRQSVIRLRPGCEDWALGAPRKKQWTPIGGCGLMSQHSCLGFKGCVRKFSLIRTQISSTWSGGRKGEGAMLNEPSSVSRVTQKHNSFYFKSIYFKRTVFKIF